MTYISSLILLCLYNPFVIPNHYKLSSFDPPYYDILSLEPDDYELNLSKW